MKGWNSESNKNEVEEMNDFQTDFGGNKHQTETEGNKQLQFMIKRIQNLNCDLSGDFQITHSHAPFTF